MHTSLSPFNFPPLAPVSAITFIPLARATTLGDGLLMVHTLDGGTRTLRLPGGKTWSVTLSPRSTTVFDATTGAAVLSAQASSGPT